MESDFAKQWRDKFRERVEANAETVEVTLPSGLTCRVRKITVRDIYAFGGIIPDVLTPLVLEWFALPNRVAQAGADIDEEARAFIARHAAEYHAVQQLVCRFCLVEPRVWLTPEEAVADPAAVPIDALDELDVRYLFAVIHGAGAIAESLFRGREGAVGDGPGEARGVGAVEGRDGDGDGRPAPDRGRPAARALARPDAAPVGAYLG